jgi:hypothetical protein
LSALGRKWAATIPVLAAAGRNIKSVAGRHRNPDRSESKSQRQRLMGQLKLNSLQHR